MTENQLNENRAAESGMLTGMFRDRETTENAFKKLHERGYTKDDINFVMSDDTSKVTEGAGTGSAIGGTIGAIVGVLSAIGTSIAIPGLGIVLAGPITVGFAGAGVLFHAVLSGRW